MAKKPPRYTNPQCEFRLPDELNAEIGRIIVRWAYLEHALQTSIWNLTQLIHPIGRLAVREPRAEERVRLICDLAELRGIVLDKELTTQITKQARDIATSRDTLAHGTWFFDEEVNGWCVVLTRGKWSDDEPHHRSRSVVPEALNVNQTALAGIGLHLEKVIGLALKLAEQIEDQIEPPPEVPPSQFPRKAPKRDRAQ